MGEISSFSADILTINQSICRENDIECLEVDRFITVEE